MGLNPLELGQQLLAIREGFGLSQATAASRARAAGVKISAGEISEIETGKSSPSFVRVCAYLDAIGSSLTELAWRLSRDPLDDAAQHLQASLSRSPLALEEFFRLLKDLQRKVEQQGELLDELRRSR